MIRRANAGDEASIRDCAEKAYARYIAVVGRKPAPMVADFKAQIEAGDVHVAVDGNDFQGFIVFFPKGEHILLDNVAVLPSAAGRGVGRSLVGFCEDKARRGGFKAVHL